MTAPQPSDALVFSGATGDLTPKPLFPALQALGRRGVLNAPIVGVAKSGWTVEHGLTQASCTMHARVAVEKPFGRGRRDDRLRGRAPRTVDPTPAADPRGTP